MNRKRIVYFIAALLTLIMPCFVQSVTAESSSGAEEHMVIRFNNPTDDIAREFLTPEHDVAAYRPGVFLDIVVSKTEYRKLALRGFDVRITQTEEQLKRNLKKKSRDALEGYRDYDMVLKELQQIESDNPDICKLYDIGDTWGKEYFDNGNTHYSNFNHEIWALKVSDNVAVEEDEPSVYYLGVHHAREPISLEVAMAVLHNIVDNYKTDQAIAQRVSDTQIWFVPLVNPNGHKVVTSETNVWMRKNIRDNNDTGRFESQYGSGYTPDGVDPNRNYGFSWGDVGSSDDWNDSSYHGTGGYSEPEVQAVKKLQSEHHFVAGITYHSFGELVIWPYGYETGAVTPDGDAIAELGTAIAVSIPSVHPDEPIFEHGHYDPGPSWGLYPTGGGQDDDAYGDHGIFGYCIELATQFIPPAEEVDQICQDNLEAAMILLNRAYTSTLTGHITDAATGEPVVAEVFVHGIDDKIIGGADDRFPDPAEFRQPYKSDQDFGRYYRLLTNGTYDVTFAVDGYKPMTKTGIEITPDGQTIVDIALEKSDCPEIITISEDILPGMAGGSVFIPLSGTDVSVWEITYNGETAEVSKFKEIYRLQGLAEGVTTIILVAKGVGNGSPCQDEKELAITVKPAACPTNTVNTDNIGGAAINGSITVPLEGSNVSTWDITYNGYTVTLPENETSYEVTGLVGDALGVLITARGFEADGKLCVDEKTVPLNFTAPGIGNSSSAPSGPFVTEDTVTVSLETVNAVSVTVSDGVTIHNAEMIPANDPDENINNTWTFEYTTFIAGHLTATVTNPSGQTEIHTWNIDVSTSDRTVSGKVTDPDTGWPLYAELTFGAARIWTDPVTGEYSIQIPDIDIPFSVRAWMNGYEEQAGELSAGGDTISDIALATTPDCASGYEVGAVLNEGFDNCTLPEGWTLNNNAGTDAIWTFDTPAGYPNVTGGEGCFASCESNFWGEVDMDTELITPAIDCSGLDRVFLEFKLLYYIETGNDIIDADISNDGGATWTNVWQKSGEQFDARTVKIDISEQALGKTDVRVRFHYYNANNDFVVELDDVKVYDCIAPVSGGLVVGNIFDNMTDEYSNTAFIEDEQGHRLAASATPGDLNVSDGFYSLYLPAGSHTLTVTQETYDPNVRTVDIVDLGIVKLDFEIVAFQVPKELEIPDFSTEQIVLTWQVPGNTEGLQGYNIYRNGTKINTGLVTALTYTDTDISLWASYSYTVAAVYGTGEGTPCSQAEVNIQGDPAQAVNASDMEWTVSGHGQWFGQTEEVPDEIEVAIQSDEAIGNDELCIIATTVQGPGTISFYWNVSSEADYDFFNFYIGEDTMTPAVRISGEPGWEKLTIDVPFGTQVLRWEYEKDNSVSEGLDVGWLAQVTFEANLATLLEADLNADGKTVLTWTPVDIVGMQGYIICRDGIRINDEVVVGTIYTDTTVVSLETYCYTVKALDGNGDETVPSGQACIMPHNRILFVDADATGANNGSSWTDAFVELQSALDFALPGDEIWVAAGIYTPDYDAGEDFHTGTREASFRLKTGVAIYGGFAGTETEVIQRNWNVNKCILSGNIGDPEDNADNSYHVIYNSDVDVTAVLNGFTVAGGNADDTQYGSGGGMYNENCSPTLTNIVFANNMASSNGSGGAMYNYNCTLTMQSIVFYSNTAYYGGAVYNDNTTITMFSATFASNEAYYGGGIDNIESIVTAENCILWGNGGGQISDVFGITSVGYSIVQDGWDGDNNSDSDPMFVDITIGDLRVKPGSPAIGKGKDGQDIGGVIYIEVVRGDADGNGEVDINDALAAAKYDIGLLTAAEIDLAMADVDGNGVVNIFDALRIAEFVAGVIPDLDD
ncbi:MAG: hypothetical protein GY795_36620 [Desulfobacterales bacterium]|nr:hypothetical protein [Desulfobacterales bacterium]